MNKKINMALIGAGNRGKGIFGQYALDMPHRASFIAVVEPDTEKREDFAAAHGIPAENCFDSTSTFFQNTPTGIDAAVIATLEDERLDPVFQSMAKHWDILVEKPLCTNEKDLIRIHDATKDYPGILIVCHQMRLTPIYKTIKNLIDSGEFGEIVCIQHSENLSWHHMAHSFVRGFFNHDRLTPMLLAKSCHDLDLFTYLIGKKAKQVASFGSLKYFTKANCPKGAPEFCLQGCPAYQTCPYDAQKIYFNEDTDPAYLRQMGIVRDKNHLRELLLKNQFGRCVFQSDNNVVDNQTVQVEFEDNINVSFTMCGHNGTERRMTKISMTNGEIDFDGISGEIKTYKFEPRIDHSIKVYAKGSHHGGDRAIMDNFIDGITTRDKNSLLTPIQTSLEGHLLVFAAEEARKNNTVVDVRKFEESIRSSLK